MKLILKEEVYACRYLLNRLKSATIGISIKDHVEIYRQNAEYLGNLKLIRDKI